MPTPNEEAMSLSFSNITFDCRNPRLLAHFWAETLGRSIGESSDGYASLPPLTTGEPTLHFIRVPEGKAAKNRIHFDLGTRDRLNEVVRLVSLGATRVTELSENGYVWTVLQDPESNEFCVVDEPDAEPERLPVATGSGSPRPAFS